MSDIRVGILGFGGAGRAHHGYYSRIAGCRVAKIYDPKPEGRERAALQAPGVPVFDTLDGCLEDVDAVSVCTPDDTHAGYICAALDRGIHVMSEKPLTNSIDGIRRIAASASRSKAQLAILHQMRFVPLFEEMKRTIDRGELGTIACLEGYYVHDLRERAFQYDDWRETSDATALVYAGCHFVDIVRWLSGEEPIEAYAMAGNVAFPRYPESDLNVVLFRFPSGAIGKVMVSIGTAGPQDHSVRVYGTDASIDNAALFSRDGRWSRTLHMPRLVHRDLLRSRWYQRPGSALRQIRRNLPAWLIARGFESMRKVGPGPDSQYGARYFPNRLYEHSLACMRALRNFIAAIRGEEPVRCRVDESARTVLACLAAVESFRKNRPMPVPRLEEVIGRSTSPDDTAASHGA